MRGADFVRRSRACLRRRGLARSTQGCPVEYWFDGGDARRAEARDNPPVGMRGVAGVLVARRLAESPFAPLLSLRATRELGLALDVARAEAALTNLGLTEAPPCATREGGPGLHVGAPR